MVDKATREALGQIADAVWPNDGPRRRAFGELIGENAEDLPPDPNAPAEDEEPAAPKKGGRK